jgi:hypothetical protein
MDDTVKALQDINDRYKEDLKLNPSRAASFLEEVFKAT